MKLSAGSWIAAFVLLLGGCGGQSPTPTSEVSTPMPSGGGDSTSPPSTGGGDSVTPPVLRAACKTGTDRGAARGGIGVGESGAPDPGEMRLIVAETGEFRWISPSGWDQQIFGTFRVGDGSLESDDALWVRWHGLTWLETIVAGVNLSAELDGESNLSLRHEADSSASTGDAMSFAPCDSVYARGSSLASIAGTYVDGDLVLAIDGLGEIFLHDRSCVGHGKVELIDSTFNMYRMDLQVSACAGNEVYAIGSTFSGLAYLGDSGPGFTGDLLEYSLSSAAGQHTYIWTRRARR